MAPRFNQIKYYSGGGAPRTLSGPNVKIPKFVEPKIPPGVYAQLGQGLSKVAAAFLKDEKDKKDKAAKRADEDAATKMIEALTAPKTPFDPAKDPGRYGAPDDSDLYAEPAEFRSREQDAHDQENPYGAALVRANQARGDYNIKDNRDWWDRFTGVDKPEGMGPESRSTMRKILLGDMAKTDAAELLAGERRYNRSVAERLAENKLAAALAKRGNVKYGNTPIWGTDKGGRPIVMQSSSAGGPLRVADLPEGVTAQRGGTRTVDLGDRYAVLDANGGLIGYRAKGIDPEKTPTHAGSVAAAKAGGTGFANKRLKDYSLARDATDNIKDIDMLTSRLLSTDEGVVGFLVDLRVFRDQALAKFGSQEALARVTDTQMVNTLTGKEVFPLIKALGIGARGLDTPAERKFLREVLTGDKTLTKDTLLEMAAMRRKVQVRNIERWNKDFKEGSLNDFLKANNIPNRAFTMPPPAPVFTPVDISGEISTMTVIQLNEKLYSGATADEKRRIGLRLDALGH